jgi:AbiV family abortive infection protein
LGHGGLIFIARKTIRGHVAERKIAPPLPAELVAAMAACVNHARALLESADAVQTARHPNIAYHLAALALEELGRRELMGVQSISSQEIVPPAWPKKHEQSHVKKLFWCFFGGNFLRGQLTKENLDGINELAQHIHDTRKLGLYVESTEDGLSIPSENISEEDASHLIQLAKARLTVAESEKLRDDVSDHDIDLQTWFLSATDDSVKSKQILSSGSLKKLAELDDVRAWATWLKEQFDQAEREAREAVQKELERSQNLPDKATKDKWKLRIRIVCASHSLRPKAFTTFNSGSKWIKIFPVSGKKNEVMIEFILGDNVPAEALWFFGWGLARSFVVALNIGTMGFWWWRMPEQISRYYETLQDLETGKELVIERNPILKIDWGKGRVLTERDLLQVVLCFNALPRPNQPERQAPLNFYIGGLTFLSLNDIHWQCEGQAFGNFMECLRAMMMERGELPVSTPLHTAFVAFLDEMFPGMAERERYTELCRKFDQGDRQTLQITLSEVAFLKICCDAYFMKYMIKQPITEPVSKPEELT